MKWLRRSLLVLAFLILALAAAAAWLVGTSAGAHWTLQRVDALLEQPLTVAAVEGAIASELTLREVHYGDEQSALEVQADRASVDLAFTDLLRGLVHIDSAAVEDLTVSLRGTQQEQPARSQSFDPQPPLDVILDRLVVRQATVRRSGERLIALDSLQLAGRWTDAGADLDVRWADVQLPALSMGKRLDTDGSLQLHGTLQDFSAEAELAAGPPDHMADIDLKVRGSASRIEVQRLRIEQQAGDLDVNGEVQLRPQLQWDLHAAASSFDPGVFLAAWDGNLSFALTTQGSIADEAPHGELYLHDLRGRLRGRSLSGSADLTLTSQQVLAGHLTLQSGDSRIRVRGERAEAWNATAQLEIASLDDWIPHSSGALRGRFSVEGQWPSLHITGSARATDLDVAGVQIDAVSLLVDVENPRAPRGSVDAELDDTKVMGFTVDSATLQLSGDPQQHTLVLAASGEPVSVELRAQGSRLQDGQERWRETIQRLALDLRDVGEFSLQQPATVTFGPQLIEISPTCLARADARLCVSGRRTADGAMNAQYRIEDLPLALIQAAAPTLPVSASGSIAGEGELHREQSGRVFGELSLRSAQGSVAQSSLADTTAKPVFTYQDLQLQASLDGADVRATIQAQLHEDGSLQGTVSMNGLGTATRPLDGFVTATIPDIAALTLLTPQLANVHGKAQLRADIDGTLDDPLIALQLHAQELTADIPTLGLHLREGVLDVEPRDAGEFTLSGSIRSGDGRLEFEGTANDSGEVQLDIEGKQILAADIPGAHVVATPDLQFTRNSQRMVLSGDVRIPSATINVQDLPRIARAQRGSADVVIVDAKTREQAAAEKIPLYADVDVILDEDVAVSGFGLQAQVAGQIAIDEAPGAPTTGSGELRVSGTYQAYGQDLTITQGSIVYAGTPLDNPSLRITAVRQVDDVTAGLRIAGTAQSPELSVFSDPVMDNASALSYLVTGRPLEEIGEGEGDGDLLQSAARSLGTAAGNLLSKRLGARLGIDTIGVEESEILDGAAFTVGEYLSPRLYLSYGVGLFEPGDVITLRYRLSDDLAVRAVRGPEETRAGIEYRIER